MFDNDIARENFEKGMSAFIKEHFEDAVELFTKTIDNDPLVPLAYVSRGAAYTRLERTEDSIRDFTRAIELKSDYARAYHLRGLEFEKTGDTENALSDFDKAVELDPEYGAAYYSRAAVRSKTGQNDLAAEDMATVAMLTEKNINSFANENNIWRSHHLKLETEGIADVMDR
ncbi:MAG: tetratricopeptide repeat protein [Desulfobacterales bacterium]